MGWWAGLGTLRGQVTAFGFWQILSDVECFGRKGLVTPVAADSEEQRLIIKEGPAFSHLGYFCNSRKALLTVLCELYAILLLLKELLWFTGWCFLPHLRARQSFAPLFGFSCPFLSWGRCPRLFHSLKCWRCQLGRPAFPAYGTLHLLH